MRVQTLAEGEFGGNETQRLRARFADFDQAAALLKIVDAERRRKARRSRGGQHVVRPGAVVAQAFAGEGAQKNRAGMFEQRLPALRVARTHLQVFGRDAVAQRAGFFHRAGVDQRAAPFERRANHVAPRHRGQQALDLLPDLGDVVGVGAEQNALRQLVMFGLAEQVHRHPVGRCAAIGEHEDFTRPGDHVDADLAEHTALRARHIGVPRAGDLVDRGNRGGAIRECGNRLRTADREHPVHPGDRRGRQHERVAFAD